jgi:hypothetical protein
MSIGAYGVLEEEYSSSEVETTQIFNMIGMIIILLSTIPLRNYQYNLIKKFDEDNITPSDFTVFL